VLNANVRPSEELAASLQSADVFLAIAGSHQGQIAQTSDDDDRPRAGLGEFVEAEYQRARELGKPTLLFWHADADTRIPVATFRRLHVTYKDVHWFRSPEELGARVIAALTAWNESASEREARPQRPAAESARDAPSIVRVFYATDRAAGGNRSQGAAYRDARGELSYGRAEVSIPIVHRIGDLESPTITRLQFRQDPARHVTLQKVELLERAVLIGELRRLLSEVTTRDALIFVHGYSVTFDDATRRIGQVSYDLRFGGAALLFSWPSTDSRIRYSADEASAEWSTSHFAEFLGLVRAEIGAQVVHVISHGMGARCVARALSTLEPASAGSTQAVLGQVVFVAPDLDAGVFVSLAEQFRRKAERITLYVSSTDRALTAARQMHGYPRAGDAGSDLLIVDGVDTIDATEAQTDLVGHSYVTPLLPDLYSLLDNVPPQGRARLQPAERAGKVYYRFSP